MIYVPGMGPSTAKMVLVGEAPSKDDESSGQPFSGASGMAVRDLLRKSGIEPDAVYFTNVLKHRPPGGDIEALHQMGKKLEDYTPQLWEEIHAIKPNVVLGLGNLALNVLTGERGIEKFRGSILQSCHGYPKVINTIHPASLMHKDTGGKLSGWKDLTFITWDVQRAIRQSEFAELRLPERHLQICHNSLDLYRFMDKNEGKPYVSVDIETFQTIPICIGISFDSREALSIPLFSNLRADFSLGASDLRHIWRVVADLLADPKIGKIGQNFKFDQQLLSKCLDGTTNFGLRTNGFFFDTMLGFRTVYPELSGKLEFIASVLTEEPYWKDEGKEYNPKKDKLSKLLLYNAKDAAVTYECFERILEELQERGLEDFFFTKVMPLHPFYSRLEGVGIKRDDFRNRFLDQKYKQMEEDLNIEFRQVLNDLGFDYLPVPNVMSNGMKGQVAALLYGHLKIPLRNGTDEATLDALMRNTVKDEKKRRCVELILKIRKVRKTRGTYIAASPHPDGRLRTGYRIMVETGRTSTSVFKAPVTTRPMGVAFQTITKHGEVGTDLRSQYVPDEGYVFLEPDLSQAEARAVAILARDERLLKIFKYGIDKHRVTAGWIFDCCPSLDEFFTCTDPERCQQIAKEINKKLKDSILEFQRQMGKVFGHAGNYDMGKRQASASAEVSEWKAGQLLAKFHDTNPGIREVFHKDVVQALQDNGRELVTPFGRKRQFLNKWGGDLFKEAYAYIPQSTISDHLKFAAQIIERRCPIIMVQESHDSFLAMTKIGDVDKCVPVIIEELQRPIDFSKCSLPRGEIIIPCEIKIGKKNWEEMEVLYK